MGKKRTGLAKKRQTKGQLIAGILVVAMGVSLVAYFSNVGSGPVAPRQGPIGVLGGQAAVEEGNRAYDAGDYAAAVRAYERALPQRGQDPSLLTDLGTAYYYKTPSEPAKAISYYDQALSVDPKFPNALFNKGIVLMEGQGKPAEAVAVWEQLLSFLSPNDPQAARVKQFIAQAREAAGAPQQVPAAQPPAFGAAVPAPQTPPGQSPAGGGSRLGSSFGR